MKKKVLIINGLTRNSLAITRSLAKSGFVIVAATKHSYSQKQDDVLVRFKSKFVEQVVFYTDASKDEVILNTLKSGAFDFVFAGGTADSIYLSKRKDVFSRYVKVVSEEWGKMQRVHDKWNCNREARELGIQVPKTFMVSSLDYLKDNLPDFDPPYILKFPDSFASKGLHVFSGAKSELFDFFAKTFPNQKELPLIQQKINGPLVDTTCFSIDGKAKAVLCQERLFTAWISGGGGIVNRTFKDQRLIDYTERLLKHFEWNGHLEIDWMYEVHSDEYYLIEVNPKFWGTTQLTIDAGYDFPKMSIEMLTNGTVKDQGDYRLGLTYRWVDDEINVIIANSNSLRSALKLWAQFIGRSFQIGMRTNMYLWSDAQPFLGNLYLTFSKEKNRAWNGLKTRIKRLIGKS